MDSAGNLYVADTDNNRLLEYTTPFVACNNPQRDNRILAREERIDQRYDPDHEQRSQAQKDQG